MTEYLSLADLVKLTDDLGVGPIRDLGLLESAVARPQTQLWGRQAYASLDEKAAALLESIVVNHALIDGNKRLGFLAAAVFYEINGADFKPDDDEAYDTVIGVASGTIDFERLCETLANWH